MRELEAKATKDLERNLSRGLVQEEERLMEEKKKKKDEKKKKEAAQKKATEQKIKVPEQVKPSVSQPQPASADSGTSTATSTNNNAKRAAAAGQQQPPQPPPPPQALPRYPREVPPRFRHQEHKQLLKRGQHFPVLAASLGPAVKVLSGQSEGSGLTSQRPQSNGELPSGEARPEVNHTASGSHYENAQQGPVSSTSDWSTSAKGAAVSDSPRSEAWPLAPGSDPESAAECVDTDPASGSESESTVPAMASGSAAAEKEGPRGSSGLGPQSKFVVGGGSAGPWGFSPASVMSTCPAPADAAESPPEGSGGRLNAWGAVSSSSNGGVGPSTLTAAGNHGAWPGLEGGGPGLKGPVGAGSPGITVQCGAMGHMPSNPSINSKAGGSSAHGTWGSLQETRDSDVSGTQIPFSGQPQNIATEMAGPNNTTNFMTSSLPNSGSVQSSELPSNTGAWRVSTMTHPQIQAPAVVNGASLPHLSNGEAKGAGSYGTAWAGYGSGCSGDACASPGGQANGDTVNAVLTQPGVNGPAGTAFQVATNKAGGVWESGAPSPQNASWGSGNGANAGGGRRGWGAAAQNTGTNVPSVEWSKLPGNQHSSDGANGNAKKFTNGWNSAEEEDQGSATPQTNEQSCVGAKAGGPADGDGGAEGTGRPDEKAAGGAPSRDRRKADQHTLLQSIVNRTDLDPRVLSNSGWGQTPIKQNTAWDTEMSPRGERKADNGTEAWGGAATQTVDSGACADKARPGGHDAPPAPGCGEPRPGPRWGGSKGSGGQGGWDDDAAATGTATARSGQWGGCKEEKPAWSDSQKSRPGWGDGQKSGQAWAVPAGDTWGDTSRSNHWGEASKKSSSGGSDSDRSVSGWNELSKASSFTWGNNINPNNSSGWDESSKPSSSQGWGGPPKSSPSLAWGDAAKPASSPDWNKQAGVVGSWGVPPAPGRPPGTGWLGGPIPAPTKEEEPTGWEEPSPESIRRKMEVDDGTSAWGDPTKYNYKNVNMWNESVPDGGGRSDQQAQVRQLLPPAGASSTPEAGGTSGWGEPWGEPPAPATVDNGTSAWGKPVDSGPSWGEPVAVASSSSTWGSGSAGPQALSKSGPKSVQDGWCGDDVPLPGTRAAGWEEEEEVEIGMWSGTSSRELSSSLHWPPYTKKMSSKGLSGKKRRRERGVVKGGSKQEDAWMNPFVKQFSNLGFPRDPPDESVQGSKVDLPAGMLPDKRMEMDKHGLGVGDYSRTVGKGPGPRPQVPKESSVERGPYFDKDGTVADEPPNLQFMSSQSMKLPPSNSALPNQALGSVAGLGMQNLNSVRQNGNPGVFGVGNSAAQPRGLQQPPAQPLGPAQPSLRAQVPPPLLSPQVPVSLLKYAPNNGGLNPLFGPQQVAMLSQLSQLNQLSQISQLQRLLAQQQRTQSQRSVPSGSRQQQEQQGRPLSVQQQMMQQSRQLDPSLLVKPQAPPSQQQPLHQPAVKSFLENVMPHAAPELQKGPSPVSAFSSFPIVGLNSNLNVNVDVGGVKEPQSRLRKWTAVDSVSVGAPLDHNSSKHGAISSGFRLEESPFVPYDFMNSSTSPASPPGSVGDGWPRAKSPNGSSSVNWPPEFRPGEPWKGYPNIDPETDPYVTPGSVINSLSVNTVREVDHLRDRSSGPSSSLNTTLPSTSAWSSIRASNHNAPLSSTAQSTSARNSDSKLTWSPGSATNTSLAHELWKVPLPPKSITAPSRPPPGLTGQKPPLSPWDNSPLRAGGGWGGSDARYTPGSSWGESSSGRVTNWLVLKNLTPQIDGSTLRTLCMQHGPLITFHLNLPHGSALVRYSSKEEVLKAQKSLHMCVLGNTTILAEFASEEEISRFFAQSQSLTPSPGWQSLGSSPSRLGSLDCSHSFSSRTELSHWGGAGLAGTHCGDLPGTSLWGAPHYSTSLWGPPSSSDPRGMSSPSPINAFLSVDHLGGGGESL